MALLTPKQFTEPKTGKVINHLNCPFGNIPRKFFVKQNDKKVLADINKKMDDQKELSNDNTTYIVSSIVKSTNYINESFQSLVDVAKDCERLAMLERYKIMCDDYFALQNLQVVQDELKNLCLVDANFRVIHPIQENFFIPHEQNENEEAVPAVEVAAVVTTVSPVAAETVPAPVVVPAEDIRPVNTNVVSNFYEPKTLTLIKQVLPLIKTCPQKRVLKDWPTNTTLSNLSILNETSHRKPKKLKQEKAPVPALLSIPKVLDEFKIPKLKLGALIVQKKEEKEQKRRDLYPEQGTSTRGFTQ